MTRSPHLPESLALLVALVVVRAASAQDLSIFSNPVLGAPESAATVLADVNGDALPDILTTDAAGQATIAWLGQGNGTFGKSLELDEGLTFKFVGEFGVADVTGDGQCDIITRYSSPLTAAELSVRAGLGSGAYAAPIVTALPAVAPGQFADMDTDGLPDFVSLGLALSFSGSELVVARSTGTGTFELLQQVTFQQAFLEWARAIADFSQDGFPDVATPILGNLAVFVGAGDGTVVDPPASWPYPGDPISASAFATGDIDLDGVPDLIVSGSTTQGPLISVLHWDSGFAPTQGASQPGFPGGTPTVGDLDADGWPDVVVVVGLSGILSVLLNDGSGGLLPPATTSIPKAGPPLLGDVNGDNFTDLYCGATVHFGSGDGTFVQPDAVEVEDPLEVVSADLTGDGIRDLVIGLKYGRNYSQDSLVVAEGAGDGSFEPPQVISMDSSNVDTVAVGDVDGDDDLDLAFKDVAKVRVMLNDGGGLAFVPTGDTFAPSLFDFEFGDLDGDGALDLVAAGINDTIFTWFGDGTGHFIEGPDVGLPGDGQDLSLVDLDHDGITDIAAAMGVSATVSWALGVGDGTFGAAQALGLGFYPSHLLVRDLNDDDLPDLVVAEEQGLQLDVLLADTPGTYGNATEYPLVAGARDIDAADVDLDGHPDLLVAAGSVESLGVLLNHGEAELGAESLYLADKGARSVATADFDGDGRPDVALACGSAEKVTIHRNELSHFPNLGYQLPISTGSFQLLASGEPVPDQLVTVGVTGLTQPAAGFLVLGLQFAPMPFHGGTLVPSPDAALPMASDMPLEGRWPQLPAGQTILAQAWFDAGGEVGATNAVVGVTK